jgi:anti-sigma factor RsiW
MEPQKTSEIVKRILDKEARPDEYSELAQGADGASAVNGFAEGFGGFSLGQDDPQIPEESIHNYIDGKATDIEREIIESFAEVDDNFASHIQALREAKGELELRGKKVYAPEPKKTATIFELFNRKSTRWVLDGSLAAAAGIMLVLLLTQDHGTKLTPTPNVVASNADQKIADLTNRQKQLENELNQADSSVKKVEGDLAKTAADKKALDAKATKLDSANKSLNSRMRGLLGSVQPSERLRSVRVEAGVTAGPGSVQLLSPIGDVLPAGSVTLSWKPVPNAKSYHVTVLDPSNAPVFDEDTDTTHISAKVEGGKSYKWIVKAARQNGTSLVGSSGNGHLAAFHVLSASDSSSLSKALDGASGQDQKALVYFQFGMLKPARAAIDEFLHKNPGDAIGEAIKAKIQAASH